jgi:hypothetical protein
MQQGMRDMYGGTPGVRWERMRALSATGEQLPYSTKAVEAGQARLNKLRRKAPPASSGTAASGTGGQPNPNSNSFSVLAGGADGSA